jgi:hypothetical protein
MRPGLHDRIKDHLSRAAAKGRLSLIAVWIIILAIAYSNYYNKFWKEQGRIIAYDVISYYQYLPAAFVYHDLTMRFIEKDPASFTKKIWANKTETGNYMGRMTMGLSVMYSPFFLTAHILAPSLGFEADGFSPPYRMALIIASITYLGLGLFLLRKLLKRYFNDWPVALALVLTGLATNLYFYTVIEPTMSHAFSFCLFALFLVLMVRWLDRPSMAGGILLGLTTGLIILVRPSNGIIVLLIPLWEVGSMRDLRQRFIFIIGSWKKIVIMALVALLMVLPQLIYWKFVSGHWLNYTYNDEGFFFNNPQFIRGMFSYRKGWLVYTPVMTIAVIGFYHLYRRRKELFWPVIVFTLVNMYIVFSWWSWWYGGGFGQRALIESYTLLALPLTAFIAWALERKWFMYLPFCLLAGWFIFLNIFQTRQYYWGSIHWEGMTREAYWDSFLHYRPSEKFPELIRYPDVQKAKQGIYEDIPVVIREKPLVSDTTGRAEYIRQLEEKIRSDSGWMENIRAKAAKWGKPVDSVIRNDAGWMWEQNMLKNGKQ